MDRSLLFLRALDDECAQAQWTWAGQFNGIQKMSQVPAAEQITIHFVTLIYGDLLISWAFTDTCGRITHSIPNTSYVITYWTYNKAQNLKNITQNKQTLHWQTFYELVIMNSVLSLSTGAVLPLSRKAEMSLSPIQLPRTKEMNSTLWAKNIFLNDWWYSKRRSNSLQNNIDLQILVRYSAKNIKIIWKKSSLMAYS